MSQAVQNAVKPFVVYQRILSEREHAMGQDTGLAFAVVQLSMVSSTEVGAVALAVQVRDALQDYTGTSATVEIQRSFLEDERDLGFDIQMQAFTRQQDYRIWHRES